METITDKIREWSIERNLHVADPNKQALKLGEELGELFEGLVKGNEDLIKDSIGDIYVVLTILSQQLGFTIEECIEMAYDEIKDRKGKMIDGVFVKESDYKKLSEEVKTVKPKIKDGKILFDRNNPDHRYIMEDD